VQALELGVAQHEAVLRVPQHEGFGNGLDRVAQAQVGGGAALGEADMFGDVHGDADEMGRALAALMNHLGAGAQPDPFAVGVAHPEGLVDRSHALRGQLLGDLAEIAVVGVHEFAEVAEREEFARPGHGEHVVHGIRPIDAAGGEVPVPQSRSARD